MPQIVSKRPFGHGPAQGAPNPFIVPSIPTGIEPSDTQRTIQPPSCIEFFRGDNRIFVVGTYMLLNTDNKDGDAESDQSRSEDDSAEKESSEANPQRRIGSIIIYRLDESYAKIQEKRVVKLQQAVFDLHFHPKHHDLLGVATSSSKFIFLKLNPSTLSLQYLFSYTVHEDYYALTTSFSWSPFPPTPNTSPSVSFTTTFSDGWVSHFEDVPLRPPRNTKRLSEPTALQSHTLEAWFSAFYLSMTEPSTSKPEVIRRCLSAGDDATLTCNNLAKVGMKSGLQPPTVAFSDNRIHTAGVTCILPLPSLRAHLGPGDLILTGSYDESIRLIHISSSPPFARKTLIEENLGGGVWRLKLLSDIQLEAKASDVATKSTLGFLVLASCMHAGPKVLRFQYTFIAGEEGKGPLTHGNQLPKWEVETLGGFEAHESMNYGSDWTLRDVRKENERKGPDNEDAEDEDKGRRVVVVSTSFYDKRVCIWKPFGGVS